MRTECFLPRQLALIALLMATRVMAFVPRHLGSGYPADVAGSVMKWDLTTYPDGAIPFFGPGVTITRADARRTISLRLSLAPDAPLGPRLLQVTTSSGTAFLSGALTVVAD